MQTVDLDTGEILERLQVGDRLREEFPANAIKEREGAGRKMFRYVSTDTVIRRLNNATGNQWSFTIKHEATQFLSGGQNRNGNDEQVMMVYGELTIPGLGTRGGYGVQRLPDPIVNTDDLLKAAAGDALKRAAVSFGVAIDLYGPDLEAGGEPAPVHPDNIPGVTRGVPQQQTRPAQATAPARPARLQRPAQEAAPAPAQGKAYPKVPGISKKEDLFRYMEENGFEGITDFKTALAQARKYGKEIHHVDDIIVGTGEVDPKYPQDGPKIWPSDIANALGYWFTMEAKASQQQAGAIATVEEQGNDEDIPFD